MGNADEHIAKLEGRLHGLTRENAEQAERISHLERTLERLIEYAQDFLGVVVDGVTKPGDITLFDTHLDVARDALIDGQDCG